MSEGGVLAQLQRIHRRNTRGGARPKDNLAFLRADAGLVLRCIENRWHRDFTDAEHARLDVIAKRLRRRRAA